MFVSRSTRLNSTSPSSSSNESSLEAMVYGCCSCIYIERNVSFKMSISEDDVMNAYAKWSVNAGGAKEFSKIWTWIKKNDSVNALMFYKDKLKFKALPGHRLPAVPDDHTVIRIPRGQKFDRDQGSYGIGTEIEVTYGARRVMMVIEPGFRPDGVLRLVTLKNIINK